MFLRALPASLLLLEVLHKTQKASPLFELRNSNTNIRGRTAFQVRSRISRQGSLSGKEHLQRLPNVDGNRDEPTELYRFLDSEPVSRHRR